MGLVHSHCIVLLPVATVYLCFLLHGLSGALLKETTDPPTRLSFYAIVCIRKDLWVCIFLYELPSDTMVVSLFTLSQLQPLGAARVCAGILCQPPTHLFLSVSVFCSTTGGPESTLNLPFFHPRVRLFFQQPWFCPLKNGIADQYLSTRYSGLALLLLGISGQN